MLDILWFIVIIFIIFIGVLFSKKIYYKNYKFKKIIKRVNKNNLFLSLGTKMGVGTLIGTTMSLYIGGPSSILWMAIFTLLSSSIIYIESLLGYKYKQKNNGSFISGIYFYTKYGLKKNKLALFMLVLFISTYSFLFLMIQTNTISNVLKINKAMLIIIFQFFIIMIITNNIFEIRKILNIVISISCIILLTFLSYAVMKNLKILPSIISLIFKDFLKPKSLFIGMIIGIKRSIFLNEILIGTASMSSGINDEDKETIANTLIVGSYFIVFIISFLICFLLLIYIYNTNNNPSSYINFLVGAFHYHFKIYGEYFLCLLICLLGSSSIISGIYIGKNNISYLTTNKTIKIFFYLLIDIFISLGIIVKVDLIWRVIDIIMLLLIIFNSFIILKLKDHI